MSTIQKIILVVTAISFVCFSAPDYIRAQSADAVTEETLEGKVVDVIEQTTVIPAGAKNPQLYQKLEILITKGLLKGETVTVENGNLPMTNVQQYVVGDELVLSHTQTPQDESVFYITDYVRRGALLQLFIIFVVLVLLVGGVRGATSLLGMAASFGVIFVYVLPQILHGADPVQTAILGSLVIIPATFFLSHGVNKKTLVAVFGTLIALVLTGVLAQTYVGAAKLTGLAAEEAGFLQAFMPGLINTRGLLLAGIIIGVLGVLDDITVSQSSIVEQLASANPKMGRTDLYKKAMIVGKDHIASMVNTLILVYTGAALPLLLLFVNNPHPFLEVINYEIIADEIVRTFVGSIGLIVAVPVTTLLAVYMIKKEDRISERKL